MAAGWFLTPFSKAMDQLEPAGLPQRIGFPSTQCKRSLMKRTPVFSSGLGDPKAIPSGAKPNSTLTESSTRFTMNIPKIQQSCSIYSQPAPTTEEIRDLYNAIQKVAVATKVDHRFIFAIIMQESSGCPRAATSTSPSGVKNPGLMQDHNGTNSCNHDGKVQTPCPSSTIEAMINDGTAGTDGGEGLAGIINQIGGGDNVQVYYEAARYYNAGFLDKSGDLGAPGATRCYASDIANRLIGLTTSPRTCDLDE